MVADRPARRRRDDGASAVEFALVVPVLLALVFGIIDFGIFFADSVSARSGVREAARQAVVGQCPTMACIADLTRDRIDPIAGGTTYVKVTAPGGWKRGNDVLVCTVVKVDGVTGLTPLPNASTTRAKVTMRIEQDANPPSPATGYSDDPVPGGWAFCR